MMEQNSSKKVLLSVLGVAILIVAVVGISFAALNYNEVGGTNTITTGTVTMSFAEATKGINLQNALPMDEITGKGLDGDGEYFDFSVSTGASAATDVKYEVSVYPVPIETGETVGALENNQVMIYLEEKNSDGTYVEKVAPGKVSALTASNLRANSLVLMTQTDTYEATGGSNTHYYRLRIWVASDVDSGYLSAVEGKHFEYKIRVDVDGYANAIGATTNTPAGA